MKRNLHPLLFPLIALFFCQNIVAQTCQEPIILDGCGELTAVGGLAPGSPTIFCEGQEVIFVNNSEGIDSTIYCWGDGEFTKVAGAQHVSHVYDFPEDTCIINNRLINLNITMIVIKHCGDGRTSSHSITTPVAIRVKPKADFDLSSPFCIGEDIALINTSCPNDNNPSYLWTFEHGVTGDITTSTNVQPSQRFAQPGEYLITLAATNQCGTDVESKRVYINAPPTAMASATLSSTPSSGCLPLTVTMSNQSQGMNTFRWSVSPDNGYRYLNGTNEYSLEPVFYFTKAKTYKITLETSNECGTSTWDQVIEVIDKPNVTLLQPPTGCESLAYTPSVNYKGKVTSYQWIFEGGTPAVSNEKFPANIYYDRPGNYKVTMIAIGPCGVDSVSQTVKVLKRENIVIEPVPDVCNTSDTISLRANFPGGTWFGSPAVTVDGIFHPGLANIGVNVVRYRYGPAGCDSEGSIDITVKTGSELHVSDASTICIDNGNVQLNFSPAGGVWTGTGIVDSTQGIFDPAQAGAGNFNLKYIYREPVLGCVSSANHHMTVVGLPEVNMSDSISICATNQYIKLEDHFNAQLQPENGFLSWQGQGVDTVQGTFNAFQAGGIGSYSLTATYVIPPGCTVSKDVLLRVKAPVQALATQDTSVCRSQGSFQLIGLPAGGIWSGPGIHAQTGVINLMLAGTGSHTYTYVTEVNTTCESRATTKVEIISDAAVSAGSDIYVCESETIITLPNASPANGIWSGPAQVVGNQLNIDSLTPGNYTFKYTSPSLPSACNSDALVLNILPRPAASFVNDSLGCKGNEIRFFNQSTHAQRYAWNFGNGTTSIGENPVRTFNTAGNYNITLEAIALHPITNQALCSTPATGKINIIESPAHVDFRMDQSSGCADLAVSFDNISVGQHLNYTWKFGNFLTSNASEPGIVIFPSGIEDTTYQVVLSAVNGCGGSSVSKTITVLPKPHANFGVTFNEPCSGDTLLLNNTTTGDPRDFRWYFSNGQYFNRLNPPPIIPFTDTIPTTLDVLLVASNECGVDSLKKTITVNPTDVRALFHVDKRRICLNDTLRLTNFSTPGAPFRWVINDGNTYVSPQVNHVFREPGMYKVVLYAQGCGFDSLAVPIEIMPLPELELDFTPAICAGLEADFEMRTTAPGATLYFGDGDSTLLKISKHKYNTPSTYKITGIATSMYGCANSIQKNLEVIAKPQAAMITSDSVCIGAAATFESLSTGAQTCRWLFGNGEMDDGCYITHEFETSGIHEINLLAISDMGCVDTAKQILYVRPTPKADFAYDMIQPCAAATVAFRDSSQGMTSCFWNFGDGNTSNAINPVHTYQRSGTYEVRLIANNDDICQSEITKILTVFESPKIETEVKDNCTEAEGSNLNIRTIPGSFVTINGPDYYKQGTFHEGLRAGSYDIIVETPHGCRAIDKVVVVQPQELEIGLMQDTFRIDLGDSVRFDLQYNQQDVDIQWSPSKWLSDATSPNPTARPMHTKAYIVTVVNDKGCVKLDTAFMEVQVRRDVFLPNTFTPDGNGVNDVFRVRSSNPAVMNVRIFEIYDRWGKLLFRQEDFPPNDVEYGWKGTAPNGTAVQPGVYTYYALVQYVDGMEQLWEGKILLLR